MRGDKASVRRRVPRVGEAAAPADSLWAEVRPVAVRRILAAATTAFSERGYHGTSTRDIARVAGMSPAAVYIHFETKELLLFAISKLGHEMVLEVTEAVVRAERAPEEALRDFAYSFAVWHADYHVMARVVQYELHALTPDHIAELALMRHKIERHVQSILQAGVAAKTFAVPDVRRTALAILSLCIDVARWFREGADAPADVGAVYAELVVRMVASIENDPPRRANGAAGRGSRTGRAGQV